MTERQSLKGVAAGATATRTADTILRDTFDLGVARAHTPGCVSVVHLNNAGAALMPEPVVQAIMRHLRLEADTGGYEAADRAQDAIELVYDRGATLLGCCPHEIAIVENATRAWTLALEAIPLTWGDRILIGRSEYVSNCLAIERVCSTTGARVGIVPNTPEGAICVDALRGMIDERVRLIALTHIATCGGALNPAALVGGIARSAGIAYMLDACQSAGQLPIDVDELACDFLTVAGRKYLRGPRGTAMLYVRSSMFDELRAAPLDVRGTHWLSDGTYTVRQDARRFETWETNCASKIGLGIAIDYALQWGLDATWARIHSLGERLRSQISALPRVQIHDPASEVCGIVSFRVAGRDASEIQRALSDRAINVSVSEAALTPYRALADETGALIRVSAHYYNSEDEVDSFSETMAAITGPFAGLPRPLPSTAAGKSRELVVAVVLAPRTSDLETWGDADVVRDVRNVLADAGVRCTEVLVDSLHSVDALTSPNLLAFPNARHFHDADGSCGSIPELLKVRGIPFLGSDAEGHAARSKTHMKAALARHGLPTPGWTLIMEDTMESDVSELRFPLIVKPDDSSESVGVVRVDDVAALRQLRLCGDGPTIAEEWVRAREFTVAVIGNGVQRRGFPLEVVLSEQNLFLTAEIKQQTLAGTTTPVVDAVLSKRLEDLAMAVAMALQIDDWCRVDILEDAEGNLYAIDVNTLPGLRRQQQRVSYFPLCLQYAYGAGFADTILALVAVGLLRHGIALPAAVQAAHAKMLAAHQLRARRRT